MRGWCPPCVYIMTYLIANKVYTTLCVLFCVLINDLNYTYNLFFNDLNYIYIIDNNVHII
jgi:hypothetical protein